MWQAKVLENFPNSDFVTPQEQINPPRPGSAGQGVVGSTNRNLKGNNTQLAVLQADMKFMMRSIAQSNHIQVVPGCQEKENGRGGGRQS